MTTHKWLIASVVVVAVGVGGMFFGYFFEKPIPVLSIFCFQGYTEPEWVKPFEKKHGCKIRITYTQTIEEMFQKTFEAPSAFHLLSIDSGRTRLYRQAGLIQAIDTSRLSNYERIHSYFRNHPFSRTSDGRTMHVPIVWGTQSLTINTSRVSGEILQRHLSSDKRSLSLDILIDPSLKGHTAFFDEAANVFAIAAIHEGVDDPHHFKDTDWERVENRIRKWMYNAAEFTTGIDDEFNAVASGRVWVLLGGNDAILNIRLEQAGLRSHFAQYPITEGTYCWIDGWVITNRTVGRELELAHAFIDEVISEQGQKMLVEKIGFGPVSVHGRPALPHAVSQSAYWYADDMDNFPTPMVIMAPEDDPKRRITDWIRLKKDLDRLSSETLPVRLNGKAEPME